MPRLPSSRLRQIRLSCIGLLVAIGFGLWAAQDLPRWVVATMLSSRLAASVHLDRFEILDTDRFRLTGLAVDGIHAYPFVETLRFEELVVEGSLRGILGGRFDRLRLRGTEARLAPAPRIESSDEPLPRIGELLLEPASIRIGAAGGDDLFLCVEAVGWGIGAAASGEARLSSAALELAPILALIDPAAAGSITGQLRDFAAELSFDAAGARLDAQAARASIAGSGGALELSEPRWSAGGTGMLSVHHLSGAKAALAVAGRRVEIDGPNARGSVAAGDDGVLQVDLKAQLGSLAAGQIQADWHPAPGRLRRLEARLRGIDLQRLWPDSGLEATAEVVLSGRGDRLEYTVGMTPTRLAVAPDRELRPATGSTLRVAGTAPFEPFASLQTPVWDGPVTAALLLPGAHGRWGSLRLPATLFPLAASLDGQWLGGESRRFTGSARLDSAAGRLKADGETTFQGGKANGDLAWSWDGLDLERITSLLREAGLPAPALAISGSGEAAGRLRGPIGAGAEPILEGRLELRQVETQARGPDGTRTWSLSGGEAAIAWAWDSGRARIETPEVEATGTVTVPGLEPLNLTLQAFGGAGDDLSRGRFTGTVQESPEIPPQEPSGLGIAHLTGDWRRHLDALVISGRVSLEALELDRWQRTAERLYREPALAEVELRGSASAELEGSFDGGSGAWSFAGPARLESAGFVSADGSRVIEGLDSLWQIDVRGDREAPIEAEGHGYLGGFLLLWQTFFGDFSDVEASLDARARLAPAAGESGLEDPRRWRLEIGASLPEGPAARGTLEGAGDGLRYTLSLDDRDLGATHQRYLAGLLEEQLGRLTAGGALAVRVRGNALPASWSVIGDVQLRGLHLESGGGQATVSGLDLDLPLDLRRRPGAELDLSGPRLNGRLAFERLGVRGLELPPADTDLAVEADSVGLENPITLDLLGGSLTLERLTLNHLLRPGRHLESGVELSGISLERISEELELIPLEGALNGHLTGVRLSPRTLRVDGGGEIEAFGGTVSVRDISGQDVLSRFPKLQLSADFSDIDLGALTRRLDFGEMTGVLQGTLEDLELFRGVPVRFRAHLETIHRKGLRRTVDVKAVNNITILGTGQRASVFDRGIQRFFDRYTYERLGVTMRLDQDVLLLRGLEHRGDKELFLRGRLPLRIDVVNAQPGKTVSFQTMVGRLKSLDFGGATTER